MSRLTQSAVPAEEDNGANTNNRTLEVIDIVVSLDVDKLDPCEVVLGHPTRAYLLHFVLLIIK